MKRPISDPFGVPDSPGAGLQTHTFRCNLWSIFFGNLFLFLFLSIPYWLLLWPMILPRQRGLVALLMLGVIVLPIIAGGIGAFLAPVKVNEKGIQGAPINGFIEWAQMRSCRVLWLGTWYARVTLDRKFGTQWVPLALQDRKGFILTLQEMAPIDNPLRLALEKRGY